MPDFCHLHCHTQYSLLDGAANIDVMMAKAKADGQKAVAITDHGNMFGVYNFWASADKHDVKPILGCETYVVEDRHRRKFSKLDKDVRYHQLLLAKNEVGYRNLSKLCSLGFIEGLYGKFPRIDKQLIRQYSEGIIATSCCIGSEVQQTIILKGAEEGEKIFKEWLDIFGEDYYVEIQRHNIKDIDGSGWDQEQINQLLLSWAEKHNVKVIATNDSHYVEEEDNEAHDILLCINTGEFRSKPKGHGKGKGFRFGFPNSEFYFKTKEEMGRLFSDIPFALDNTMEIVSKIETPKLSRDVLMPNYVIPRDFQSQDDYLRHLSFEGAKRKYGEINQEIKERLDLELDVIKNMGFSGYFLITQDFVKAAKEINVAVGPGRGSAAGSAVAFATDITNIDPIRYNLLFERFLNPERVSMPDIDIDFDDEGRQKVIDYVVEKYGKNQVAQIITYGKMAAKSSIKDVGRVLELPLADTNKLAKLVPDTPGTKLKDAYKDIPELKEILADQGKLEGTTLKLAKDLEGSIRQRGIHAAGVIIAPGPITDYIPVCTAKDADLLVTQFDGSVIEDAGMLKMDFLGLKTLSIIKETINLVKKRFNVDIDIDNISLDDEKTLELYRRGSTIGTFQFESPGMRKYLQELRPSDIEDLIAMNALYRPGPIEFIPDFIDRKHGRAKVSYPHAMLEALLKPTYGIMVYQEQIMQCAQIVGGFSLGKADILRRAMGKKKIKEMKKMQVEFVEGAAKNGISEEKANEIFSIMERFASYGFNRSHSAAYSVVAFQTGYLKAHYPAEYMASVLSYNMNDISKVSFFMAEAAQMGLAVLGPDVNESGLRFSTNEQGEIRFALAAIKGVGESAVEEICETRESEGKYQSIFDFVKRVNLSSVNKRCMESLAKAGAFDGFEGTHRAQYEYVASNDKYSFLEKLLKYGNTFGGTQATTQTSLFGDAIMNEMAEPDVPECEHYPMAIQLRYEKELIGMYLSGHPLNAHKTEIDNFCTSNIEKVAEAGMGENLLFACMVNSASQRTTKSGKAFGTYIVEDFFGEMRLGLFGETFLKFKHLFVEGELLWLRGKKDKRWGDTDELEFKLVEAGLLADLIDIARGITLEINLPDITESLVDELLALCTEGKKAGLSLKFRIRDQRTGVEMFSTKFKMEASKETFDALQALNVSFSLQK